MCSQTGTGIKHGAEKLTGFVKSDFQICIKKRRSVDCRKEAGTTGSHQKYQFIFKSDDTSLINSLKRDLGKLRAEQVSKLKQFQCYAIGDFILYDSDGNKLSNKGEPLKIIRIKPPNCMHYGGIEK